MKCPHCDYEDGWSHDRNDVVKGRDGDFYVHPVPMKRKDIWQSDEIQLMGCPRCSKTFIDKNY